MRGELDPDLRFGLWPQRPSWMADAVTDLMMGRRWVELTSGEAADVRQGVSTFQLIRGPVSWFPVMALAALLDLTGAAAGWKPVMWTAALTAVLLLPMYGLVVASLQLRLRRSPHPDRPLAEAHPRVVTLFRAAPWAALVVAFVLAFLLH